MTLDDIRKLAARVTARRPKVVLEHLLEHGSITTEELTERYGYEHAPRAIRDVRELGVPIRMRRVADSKGRSIAEYSFDLDKAGKWNPSKEGGRKAFPKKLKEDLAARQGSRCALCGERFASRALQVDHRVPYEIAGDVGTADRDEADFMAVCGSCNRAKSFSCEQCDNFLTLHLVETCLTCMWASPERYSHVAMEERRKLQLTWYGSDVSQYDRLAEAAAEAGDSAEDLVKRILRRDLGE